MYRLEQKENKQFKFITFDIETYISKINEFRLASIYDGTKSIACKRIDILIHELLKFNSYIIYSHAGSLFDLNFIMNQVINLYDIKRMNIVFSGSLPAQITFTINNKYYIFRDSYAILKDKLKNISEKLLSDSKLLDLNDDKIDFDNLDDNIVQEYCDKDAKLLYDAIIVFKDLLQVKRLKISVASQSMDIFRKRFLKYQWKVLSKKEIDFFNLFLHAGRVDVFKRYATNGIAIDVNQLYPYSMLSGSPIYENIIYSNRTIKDYHTIENFITNENKFGFFRIKLNSYINDEIGFLPIKFPDKFPKLYHLETLERCYNITSIELNELIQRKIPFTIFEFCLLDFKKDFFTDFVMYFDNLRQQNQAHKFISKSILNSLSGKFGENYVRQNYSISDDNQVYINHDIKLGYKISEQISDYINPFVLAHIYSKSRNFLYHHLDNFKNKICYCDTDSIFLTNTDEKEVSHLIGKEIGKFKIEKTFKKAVFITQKFYGLINEDDEFIIKAKGFPKLENHIKSYDDLIKLFNSDFGDTKFRYDRLNRLKTAFKKNEFISLVTITKQLKHIELKRKKIDKINTSQFKLVNGKLI